MRFSPKPILLCLIVVGLPSMKANGAASYHPSYGNLVREKFAWTEFPELSGKGVFCMAQDSSGVLWFGSESGILCTDGRRWRRFSAEHGLPSASPQTLCVDGRGRLYALYESDGIFVFADSLWHKLPLPAQVIWHDMIAVGIRDSLWIASSFGGLLYADGSLFSLSDRGIEAIDPAAPPARTDDIYAVYEDRGRNLWLIKATTAQNQLICIPDWRSNLQRPERWKKRSPAAAGRPLGLRPGIYNSADGRYWIYSYSEEVGLYSFQDVDGPWSYWNLNLLGGTNVVRSASETRDGILWFGGNGFLYAYAGGRFTTYTPQELDLPISALFTVQSRDGALWLLSVNMAVYRIDYCGRRRQVFEGLHYQCTLEQNRIFLSEEGRVVVQSPEDRWISYGVEDGLMDMPSVVLCSSDGSLWAAGSAHGKAAVSRLLGSRWQTDLFADLSWSIGPQAVAVDREGRLWFGSISDPSAFFRGGCVVYEPVDGTYRPRRIVSATESFNRLNSLTVSAEGRIWAGASHLLFYEKEEWHLPREPVELQKGWIDHVLGTSDGSLWVAKGGVGVFCIRDTTWRKYTAEDGLASNLVTFLLETPFGLYAAGEKGISLFDGRSWMPYALPKEIVIVRENGTLRWDPEGCLWVNLAPRDWYFRALHPAKRPLGGAFRTMCCYRDEAPPETEILLGRTRVVVPDDQYISWQGSDLWNDTPKEHLTYSTRLDDGEWTPFSTHTSIQLPDLAAGEHRFAVRARDRDGNIDPTPAEMVFSIIPPVSRQPWFIALIGSFSAAVIALLAVLSIKNRKLIESKNEIERSASFKERFFINMSHEFRTPLTMISAPIDALLEHSKSLPAPVINRLKVIQRHADYLQRLVSRLLDLRKLEEGGYPLRVTEDDLIAFVRRIMELFDWFAKTHRIRFSLETEAPTCICWFDGEKVQEILINLIGNALKYTPDGGRVTVTVERRKLPGNTFEKRRRRLFDKTSAALYDWVQITVSDSGIGIPAEKLGHIFERFYSVEHPGGLYYDSIGVGLDFTREIVETCRGRISVASIEGCGSTFTIHLPVDFRLFSESERTSAAPPPPHLPAEKSREISRERLRLLSAVSVEPGAPDTCEKKNSVLIVEDHADLRCFLADYLTSDYAVLEAEDGLVGLETAISELPDAVISDVMMPKMDGLELTRRLKEHPMTSHIPVVLLTMKSETEHRIDGYDSGADAYMTKPFTARELKAILRNLLESRRRLQEKFRQEIIVQPSEVTVTDADAEFLGRCLAVVENHIDDPDFHVDQFCRELGLSRTPAFRKIKSITGFSPNEFILHIRLKRAAQLLRDSQMNISEIAYSLGFCDHAHFTRHFRKTFGCPPKAYRRNSRSGS